MGRLVGPMQIHKSNSAKYVGVVYVLSGASIATADTVPAAVEGARAAARVGWKTMEALMGPLKEPLTVFVYALTAPEFQVREGGVFDAVMKEGKLMRLPLVATVST